MAWGYWTAYSTCATKQTELTNCVLSPPSKRERSLERKSRELERLAHTDSRARIPESLGQSSFGRSATHIQADKVAFERRLLLGDPDWSNKTTADRNTLPRKKGHEDSDYIKNGHSPPILDSLSRRDDEMYCPACSHGSDYRESRVSFGSVASSGRGSKCSSTAPPLSNRSKSNGDDERSSYGDGFESGTGNISSSLPTPPPPPLFRSQFELLQRQTALMQTINQKISLLSSLNSRENRLQCALNVKQHHHNYHGKSEFQFKEGSCAKSLEHSSLSLEDHSKSQRRKSEGTMKLRQERDTLKSSESRNYNSSDPQRSCDSIGASLEGHHNNINDNSSGSKHLLEAHGPKRSPQKFKKESFVRSLGGSPSGNQEQPVNQRRKSESAVKLTKGSLSGGSLGSSSSKLEISRAQRRQKIGIEKGIGGEGGQESGEGVLHTSTKKCHKNKEPCEKLLSKKVVESEITNTILLLPEKNLIENDSENLVAIKRKAKNESKVFSIGETQNTKLRERGFKNQIGTILDSSQSCFQRKTEQNFEDKIPLSDKKKLDYTERRRRKDEILKPTSVRTFFHSTQKLKSRKNYISKPTTTEDNQHHFKANEDSEQYKKHVNSESQISCASTTEIENCNKFLLVTPTVNNQLPEVPIIEKSCSNLKKSSKRKDRKEERPTSRRHTLGRCDLHRQLDEVNQNDVPRNQHLTSGYRSASVHSVSSKSEKSTMSSQSQSMENLKLIGKLWLRKMRKNTN